MKEKKNVMPALKRTMRYIRKYYVLLVLSVITAAVSALLMLYIPILVGDTIDCIVGTGDVGFERIAALLTRLAAVAAAAAAAQWVLSMINNKMTYGVVHDVRNDAFAKIQMLPMSYLDSHPTGETVSRVIADVDQFADGLLMGFTQFFTGIVTIIGTLVFMLRINAKIALLVIVLTPLSLFAAKFISEHTYSMFKKQSETRAEQTALTDEMISGIKVMQAYSREKQTLEKFDEINDRLEKCSLKAIFYSSLTNPVTRFVNNMVYAVVALAGAFSVISQAGAAAAFTVGRLASLLSYANQYTKPFNEISGVVTELQNALACAARIFELIDEEPQTPDKTGADDIAEIKGNVGFNDVYFSYSPEKPLIRDFSLDVGAGRRIAIVGPTGCGKTTLINLIMRFYDVNSGSITVDGTDSRDIPRRVLRGNIGMVLQETWLKSGTIRDNIVMGRPDASDEEIIAAAKAAHSYGFIRRLPDGFDTVIGEDGGSLSQGQKQLLCITRVMLCRPPMLILDEATSSIDTRTEIRIQEAFSRLMEGRTSFVVAHRLSTIREADDIIVMKDGNIVETGRHDELLAKNGFYASLYNSQFAE
ncbi:MAG: ABC transporter ATP-binding protein/permease [Oscillospiraceae bacterium]|nr:ABC transporter ATP-binding protein/permease [Oscillospiraceae bacterium]